MHTYIRTHMNTHIHTCPYMDVCTYTVEIKNGLSRQQIDRWRIDWWCYMKKRIDHHWFIHVFMNVCMHRNTYIQCMHIYTYHVYTQRYMYTFFIWMCACRHTVLVNIYAYMNTCKQADVHKYRQYTYNIHTYIHAVKHAIIYAHRACNHKHIWKPNQQWFHRFCGFDRQIDKIFLFQFETVENSGSSNVCKFRLIRMHCLLAFWIIT